MDPKSRARRYSNIRITLTLVDLALMFLYLAAFQFLGFSHLLKMRLLGIATNPYFVITAYFLVFAGIYYVIDFPLKYFGSYSLEHRFSLSNQSLLAWLKDEAKDLLLNLVISLILIQVLYIFLRNFEKCWWAWAAVFWIFFTVILARILPTLIIPLFYKYKPLQREELRQKILELTRRAGVKVLDAYEIDFSRKTKKANAAVVGLGRTRRMILADNLLRDFTDSEIGVVVGHEIGHHRLRHMAKLLLFGGAFSFLAFYLASEILNSSLGLFGVEALHDIEVFPFLCIVLLVLGLVVLPLQNGFSRALERAADAFALRLTRDKDSFVTLMNKLAEKNLSDTEPNRLVEFVFYNHPAISKRIKFAREYVL